MNIGLKIARILDIGGIAIVVCFAVAIIGRFLGFNIANSLAALGIGLTAATPIAGVIVAGYMLFRQGEKKYAIYAGVLLILMALAGVWRMLS